MEIIMPTRRTAWRTVIAAICVAFVPWNSPATAVRKAEAPQREPRWRELRADTFVGPYQMIRTEGQGAGVVYRSFTSGRLGWIGTLRGKVLGPEPIYIVSVRQKAFVTEHVFSNDEMVDYVS